MEVKFGRCKNKWQFLIHPCNTNHTLTTKMIIASCILHNLCVYQDDKDARTQIEGNRVAWNQFLQKYAQMSCLAWKKRGAKLFTPGCFEKWRGSTQACSRSDTPNARDSIAQALLRGECHVPVLLVDGTERGYVYAARELASS